MQRCSIRLTVSQRLRSNNIHLVSVGSGMCRVCDVHNVTEPLMLHNPVWHRQKGNQVMWILYALEFIVLVGFIVASVAFCVDYRRAKSCKCWCEVCKVGNL